MSVCPVCLSVCLSVCDVGVLWPNGWVYQVATSYGSGPRPRPHCIRWGPSSPRPKKEGHSPNHRPMSVVAKRLNGSRCHLVWSQASVQATLCFMGTQLPLPQRRGTATPTFWSMSVVAKRSPSSATAELLLCWINVCSQPQYFVIYFRVLHDLRV